jgi:hypothetical protein
MSGITWTACLDELEGQLRDVEQALLEGRDVGVPTWAPPTVAGPPTAEELARARAVFQRQHRIIEVLGAARDRVQVELHEVEGRRRAARAYGSS